MLAGACAWSAGILRCAAGQGGVSLCSSGAPCCAHARSQSCGLPAADLAGKAPATLSPPLQEWATSEHAARQGSCQQSDFGNLRVRRGEAVNADGLKADSCRMDAAQMRLSQKFGNSVHAQAMQPSSFNQSIRALNRYRCGCTGGRG